jgi:hypothetical protein
VLQTVCCAERTRFRSYVSSQAVYYVSSQAVYYVEQTRYQKQMKPQVVHRAGQTYIGRKRACDWCTVSSRPDVGGRRSYRLFDVLEGPDISSRWPCRSCRWSRRDIVDHYSQKRKSRKDTHLGRAIGKDWHVPQLRTQYICRN